MSHGQSNANQDSAAPHFKRVLTLKDLVIYGIAFMTPIAPAYIYGFAAQSTGGMLPLAYLIAMVAMMFSAYSYGRMAAAFPVSGSTYTYTQRAIHPHLGFFAGWAMFMDYVLVPLIVFMVGASYANALIPSIPYWVWVFIIAGVITVVNILGIAVAAKTNQILVLFMGIVVVIFVIFCMKAIMGEGGASAVVSITPFFNSEKFVMTAIISGAAMACFSFLGFDSITTLSEESVNPQNDIWKAAILSCLIGGIIFIVQAYVAQLVWPDVNNFSSADTALFDIANVAGGAVLVTLYTVAIIVSTFTAGLTGQASASRLMFSMGRDEVLPKKFFTHLHPKYKTPIYNILLMGSISIAGALFLSIDFVAELMSFGGLTGFMFVNLSVIVYYYFRKKEKKFVRYLVIPGLGFLICFYLFINLSPLTLKVGFIWLAIGVVYALITTKGFKKLPPSLIDS
ncbi:APC family permease [Peribacillus loiseleuriae]|uniref:Amino acid permease n=1 Tax=Peribacillus loiseleuriae TaxID=1679170 RepID=A0A0K9GPW8_9BACI|nr:amino acid permease [Peribacillus loiseleuriae]KMY48688.1 amino acid permease [Peribacillus loiseleuriae]